MEGQSAVQQSQVSQSTASLNSSLECDFERHFEHQRLTVATIEALWLPFRSHSGLEGTLGQPFRSHSGLEGTLEQPFRAHSGLEGTPGQPFRAYSGESTAGAVFLKPLWPRTKSAYDRVPSEH